MTPFILRPCPVCKALSVPVTSLVSIMCPRSWWLMGMKSSAQEKWDIQVNPLDSFWPIAMSMQGNKLLKPLSECSYTSFMAGKLLLRSKSITPVVKNPFWQLRMPLRKARSAAHTRRTMERGRVIVYIASGNGLMVFLCPGTGPKQGNVTVSGEFSVGSQHHFYMEQQSCLVKPIENGQVPFISFSICHSQYFIVQHQCGHSIHGLRSTDLLLGLGHWQEPDQRGKSPHWRSLRWKDPQPELLGCSRFRGCQKSGQASETGPRHADQHGNVRKEMSLSFPIWGKAEICLFMFNVDFIRPALVMTTDWTSSTWKSTQTLVQEW